MSSVLESASREDLLALIRLLQRQVAVTEARAEAAEVQAAEPTMVNERLTARVAELEQRLGRNSGNSSLPPSSDTFGRPEKKPQAKSGRKRGCQPGADGSGLAMAEKPDATENHLPAACTACGSALGESESIGFRAPPGPRHPPGHGHCHRVPGTSLPVCVRNRHRLPDARHCCQIVLLLRSEPARARRLPAGLPAHLRRADRTTHP